MSYYVKDWVECAGVLYPEYGYEPEEFVDDDELEVIPPLNNEIKESLEF